MNKWFFNAEPLLWFVITLSLFFTAFFFSQYTYWENTINIEGPEPMVEKIEMRDNSFRNASISLAVAVFLGAFWVPIKGKINEGKH